MKISNDELIRETAKRLDLPDQQVRSVMVHFFRILKKMLQYPEDYFYRGIRIKNFCKFSINPGKVLRNYLFLLDKGEPIKTANQLKIHLYNKILLKYNVYTEKQTQVQNNNERNQKRSICESGKWAHYLHGGKPD